MLKEVIGKLDYSHFDQIALVIFCASFIAICWGAMRLRPDSATRFGHIPIDELIAERRVIPSNPESKNTHREGVPE